MEIVIIKGQIEVLTGLHIGGGDNVMEIGGIDNPVIKTTRDNPYIPGSSIKGKMRFLLEWKYRLVGMREDEKKKGEPFGSDCFNIKSHAWTKSDREDAETLIKLFGDANAKVEDATKFGITRISVSDCHLSSGQDKLKLTEAKYENVIDRRSGTARHPRQSERVPAGIKFDFDIRVKIFEGDDKEALVGMVREGIKLIERDSLGGSGSRGYGRVKFEESSNATV